MQEQNTDNKVVEEITADQMMSELQAAAKPIRKAFLQKELGKKEQKRTDRKNQKLARKSHRGNNRGR